MKGYQFYMQDFKINILGSEWSVKFGNEKEYPNLEKMDGYSDSSVREIVVCDMKSSQGQAGAKADLERYQKQVVRHEVIHAFLAESGLDSSSGAVKSWATNEEMVDWFAIQSPKIFKLFSELELM
nr:MAG TPA: hypothetical protein [Caudoviricetes sp.]